MGSEKRQEEAGQGDVCPVGLVKILPIFSEVEPLGAARGRGRHDKAQILTRSLP